MSESSSADCGDGGGGGDCAYGLAAAAHGGDEVAGDGGLATFVNANLSGDQSKKERIKVVNKQTR